MAKSLVGPWALDKLERLQKYLHAYTTILRKRRFEGFYYFDAFAGPGIHEIRESSPKAARGKQGLLDVSAFGQEQPEQRAFLAGSPRIALELRHPFTAYVFIEKNADRVAELQILKEEFRDSRRIVVRKADCNRYLHERVVSNPQIDWRRNRAIVFLDPFGMQVPWNTLEALSGTKAIEVFLNFPVGMAIQRLLPRDPNKLTEPRRAILDEYFGSSEWYSELYRKRGKVLFGEESDEKIEQSGKRLVRWYRNRLRVSFGYASKASLVRNTRGAHLYYLLLASPNPTGVKIFNSIIAGDEVV